MCFTPFCSVTDFSNSVSRLPHGAHPLPAPAAVAPPRSCHHHYPRSALTPRCACQVSSSLSTPARLPFFSELPSESTPGHRQSLSPGFALLSPVAEALLEPTSKPTSVVQTDACDSDVCVSQTDGTASERAQMQPQTLVENAPMDILGGDSSVTALNVDAPAFCPVSTMAPPPPRVLAPAPAATGPKADPEP